MIDRTLFSKAAQDLLTLNADQAYRKLVVDGDGFAPARGVMASLKPADLLAKPVVRSDEAQAVLSGLWLWHDWLDESHTISQGIHTATGSYWHAIMHRREGDFSNSKYWYGKCASHPVKKLIAPVAADIVRASKAAQAVSAVLLGGFDPNALVDLAEDASSRPDDPATETIIALQKAEWEMLFSYSCKAALAIL